MFNFRIINMPNGTQIIDSNLKTPYNSLTSSQLLEYINMEACINNMSKISKRRKKDNIFKIIISIFKNWL